MFCQFSLLNIFFKSAASSPLYVQCPNSDSHRLFLAWFIAIASDLFSFLHSFPNYVHLHMKQNELPKHIWTGHSSLEIFHWVTIAHRIYPKFLRLLYKILCDPVLV